MDILFQTLEQECSLKENNTSSESVAITLISLPIEVLEHVFSFLPLEYRISTLSRVCEYFQYIVRDMLLEVIDFNQCFDPANVTDEMFSSLAICSGDNLKEMTIPHCENLSSIGISYLSLCKNLRVLHVNNHQLHQSSLDTIFHMPQLEHLVLLNVCNGRKLPGKLVLAIVQDETTQDDTNNLIHLALKKERFGVNSMKYRIMTASNSWSVATPGVMKLKALKSVKLYAPTREDLQLLGSSMNEHSNLDTLYLVNGRYLDFKIFTKVEMPTSQRLQFNDVTTICFTPSTKTPDIIKDNLSIDTVSEAEGTVYPACKVLVIEHVSALTDLSLIALASGMPNLTRLRLKSLRQISSAALGNTAQFLPHLDQLEVIDCSQINDVALAPFAQNCPKLAHVDLSGCTSITPIAIRILLDGCTYLRRLLLKECYQLYRDYDFRQELKQKGINDGYQNMWQVETFKRESIDSHLADWTRQLDSEDSRLLSSSDEIHTRSLASFLLSEDFNPDEVRCDCVRTACPWCLAHVRICQRRDHLEICRELPVRCLFGCGFECRRQEETHHWRECPRYQIKCLFRKAHFLPRKQLGSHIVEHMNSGNHMPLLQAAKQCPLKAHGCRFTSAEASSLANHLRACPSWTVKCPTCGKMVTYATYTLHRESYCSVKQLFRAIPDLGITSAQFGFEDDADSPQPIK
eukprot:gene693-3993_t